MYMYNFILFHFENGRDVMTALYTVKVVIFVRVIFRASAIFDIFACF